MTSAPVLADQHALICSGLERHTPLLADVVRRSDPDARPTKMRWTNAELAAHIVSSVAEAEKAARGLASAYDAGGPSAEVDEELVAATPERDPRLLADLIQERTSLFLAAVRQVDGATPMRAPRMTAASLAGLLALDQHLHGGQIAEASGYTWAGEVGDMFAPLSAVLPYSFNERRARGFHGSYALQLRGVAPLRYAVADGVLTMGITGPVDCKMRADPHTFLRLGMGVVSLRRAMFTGRVLAGGRKPWLAMAALRLFPPFPHGGVER